MLSNLAHDLKPGLLQERGITMDFFLETHPLFQLNQGPDGGDHMHEPFSVPIKELIVFYFNWSAVQPSAQINPCRSLGKQSLNAWLHVGNLPVKMHPFASCYSSVIAIKYRICPASQPFASEQQLNVW
jgi:hypothetical protein